MDRRTIIVPAVAIATITAMSLAIPAVAGTSDDEPRGPGAPAPRVDVPAAPETVVALRRDLALDADQAGARLRRESWAGRTMGTLKKDLGDTYAGAWMTAAGDQLVVGVTGPDAAEKVRRTGAQPRIVGRSAATLDTVKQRLDRSALKGNKAVSGWYVDAAANDVVVLARPGQQLAAAAAVNATGAPPQAIRVVASAEAPRPLFDVRGGDPYFIDRAARCSIGFPVQGGFITAGHCGSVGDPTNGFNNAVQGRFQASSFPGNDYAFVAVNAQWVPLAVVNTSGGTVPVAGSTEAPVGASVCRTGSTTGTRCGLIQARNATVNYPEGTVTGLTRTNVCAEPGDSGGPWLSGNQAQGITSGGSGDCRGGGITFFQPVNEILTANRLTLVTAGQSPGSPGSPSASPSGAPAGPCDAREAALRGALPRAGTRQVQPQGGHFRAGGGIHSACLDGTDGADFDLTLQRWNGRAWQTVADADNGSGDDTLSFTGPAGFYRYLVRSERGSGAYTLGIDLP
jgi:streptogrisin C